MSLQKLFVYGTLKHPKIQLKVLGRKPSQKPDTLEGYGIGEIDIHHKTYPIAKLDASSSIKGLVLDITDEEILLLDDYETTAYKRIEVMLKSGAEAWVYCLPEVYGTRP